MGFSTDVNRTVLENYEVCLYHIEKFLGIFDKHFKRHLSYHIKDIDKLIECLEAYKMLNDDLEKWKGER